MLLSYYINLVKLNMLSLFKILRLQFRTEGVHAFHFCLCMYVSVMLLLLLVVRADVPLQTVFTTWTGNFPVIEVTFSHWFLGPDATVVTLTRTCYPLGCDEPVEDERICRQVSDLICYWNYKIWTGRFWRSYHVSLKFGCHMLMLICYERKKYCSFAEKHCWSNAEKHDGIF